MKCISMICTAAILLLFGCKTVPSCQSLVSKNDTKTCETKAVNNALTLLSTAAKNMTAKPAKKILYEDSSDFSSTLSKSLKTYPKVIIEFNDEKLNTESLRLIKPPYNYTTLQLWIKALDDGKGLTCEKSTNTFSPIELYLINLLIQALTEYTAQLMQNNLLEPIEDFNAMVLYKKDENSGIKTVKTIELIRKNVMPTCAAYKADL
ncbi:MAG: hypothetical protein V4660_20750 [Pseudomonadota bacterium]